MYSRRFRRCCCMNNNCAKSCDKNMFEDSCQNVGCSCNDCNQDDCGCGFDEEISVFPENPMLSQSYVPIQYMDRTFKPNTGLKMSIYGRN